METFTCGRSSMSSIASEVSASETGFEIDVREGAEEFDGADALVSEK